MEEVLKRMEKYKRKERSISPLIDVLSQLPITPKDVKVVKWWLIGHCSRKMSSVY